MSNDRIEQLRQFYQDDPNDPFNLYALALEYLKHDVEQSKKFFEKLLQAHEEYLPAYYHAAKLYQDLDLKNLAMQTYQKGIALAKRRNEHKTLRELDRKSVV